MKQEYCLSDLKPGQKAHVRELQVTGSIRRRLLDLGLTEKTPVECVGSSPSGDPCAYFIRGAVIAIRREDGKKIRIDDTKGTRPGRVVAIAGNPNVGKSTVFNGLTGLKQHTGNWTGTTVTNTKGYCETKENTYVMVDIPGTYSLLAHSKEEEVARNFICFGKADTVLVVCDATCLERNLNLVLQIMEVTGAVMVCVNLIDEAKRKQIQIDIKGLSKRLGVPVAAVVARNKKSLSQVTKMLDENTKEEKNRQPYQIPYSAPLEEAIALLQAAIAKVSHQGLDDRWLSLRLLEEDASLLAELKQYFGKNLLDDTEILAAQKEAKQLLKAQGISEGNIKDLVVSGLLKEAEDICQKTVVYEKTDYHAADRRIDKIVTGRGLGYPLMLLLLIFVLWLTIAGANYPSKLLADGMFWLQDKLSSLFVSLNAPSWLHGILIDGGYRVLAWVVSVMLPPMAIFFPLFTLLEDAGYLPRVAYNLDKSFQRCKACGKQSLSMCMGLGCNAAGVIGCRIIDSPRERLIAILTNSFVPCNGRFPAMIMIITMFLAGTQAGAYGSILGAVILSLVILFGIGMTFVLSAILSHTILKGMPSAFTLELPPYRKPQLGKVIIRSICDRTMFVLGRATAVAVPAGMILWIMANVPVGSDNLLNYCASLLDPFARLMGLDGVILIAFILGLPANEIVFPIILMAYLSKSSLMEIPNLMEIKEILLQNGWTWVTAVCTVLFSLLHWPCSTTLWTIKKETGGFKWVFASVFLSGATAFLACFIFRWTAQLFGA